MYLGYQEDSARLTLVKNALLGRQGRFRKLRR